MQNAIQNTLQKISIAEINLSVPLFGRIRKNWSWKYSALPFCPFLLEQALRKIDGFKVKEKDIAYKNLANWEESFTGVPSKTTAENPRFLFSLLVYSLCF